MNLNLRTNRFPIFAFFAAFIMAVVFSFQNCSPDVGFGTAEYNDLSSQASRKIEVPIEEDTTKIKPLVKLFLIIDNSNSMYSKQSLLASGIQPLIQKLQGYNVDVHLLTTTSLNTAAPNFSTGAKSVFTTQLTYLDAKNTTIADWGTYTNSMPISTKAYAKHDLILQTQQLNDNFFQLRQTMQSADLSAVANSLYSKILNTGIDGSKTESGMCTLVRLLKQGATNARLQAGDKALYLILSDEDDVAQFMASDCSESVKQELELKGNQTFETCRTGQTCTHAAYVFRPKGVKVTFSGTYSCSFGTTSECTLNNEIRRYECFAEPCPSTTINCSTSTITSLKSTYPGLSLGLCTESPDSQAGYIITVPITINPCSQAFVDRGTTYNNAADWLQKHSYGLLATCEFKENQIAQSSNYWSPISTTSTSAFDQLLVNSTVISRDKAIQKIIESASRISGPTGYQISAIIHDQAANTSAGCTLNEADANYGEAYKKLINSIKAPGTITSICSSNYSSAVVGVEDFVKRISLLTYTVDLAENEYILQVNLKNKLGNERLLKMSEVTFTGNTIQLANGSIAGPGDELVVYIGQ